MATLRNCWRCLGYIFLRACHFPLNSSISEISCYKSWPLWFLVLSLVHHIRFHTRLYPIKPDGPASDFLINNRSDEGRVQSCKIESPLSTRSMSIENNICYSYCSSVKTIGGSFHATLYNSPHITHLPVLPLRACPPRTTLLVKY